LGVYGVEFREQLLSTSHAIGWWGLGKMSGTRKKRGGGPKDGLSYHVDIFPLLYFNNVDVWISRFLMPTYKY
jgi:hypothetical protein